MIEKDKNKAFSHTNLTHIKPSRDKLHLNFQSQIDLNNMLSYSYDTCQSSYKSISGEDKKITP